MRCPKAFRNFGEEKTKLFSNNHWWGDGKDPCILTYSPAVSTLFLITFNPESLRRCHSSSRSNSQALKVAGFAWLCVSYLPPHDAAGQLHLTTSSFSVSSRTRPESSALSGRSGSHAMNILLSRVISPKCTVTANRYLLCVCRKKTSPH